jgi:hypothetical protein
VATRTGIRISLSTLFSSFNRHCTNVENVVLRIVLSYKSIAMALRNIRSSLET